jgi:5-methylcytosine-specific restriction endonuclease McrA
VPPLIGDKPLTPAERSRRWRERNPEKAEQTWKTWQKNNKEKARESSRKHYYKNREREIERNAKYREENRDKVRSTAKKSYNKNREKNLLRAHLRRHEKFEFLVTDKELKRLYSQPCAACGSTENQTVDHIIPFSRGGRYSIGNLQTLCLDCNVKKANRTIMEWRLNRVAKRKRKTA